VFCIEFWHDRTDHQIQCKEYCVVIFDGSWQSLETEDICDIIKHFLVSQDSHMLASLSNNVMIECPGLSTVPDLTSNETSAIHRAVTLTILYIRLAVREHGTLQKSIKIINNGTIIGI